MNDQRLEARVMSLLQRRADEAVESFDPDLVAALAISRATTARRRASASSWQPRRWPRR